jgi:hypothetical protein
MPGCFSSSRSRLGPELGLMRLLVSLSSYFAPSRIFESVELVKVSVNGTRASWEGATVGLYLNRGLLETVTFVSSAPFLKAPFGSSTPSTNRSGVILTRFR